MSPDDEEIPIHHLHIGDAYSGGIHTTHRVLDTNQIMYQTFINAVFLSKCGWVRNIQNVTKLRCIVDAW